MKKITICAMLMIFSATSFCQHAQTLTSMTREEYLKKSKNQKTTAWVLLGGGTAVAVGAAILDVSSDWSKSETPYLVALSTGCASMLGSIPLFIASGRNKRKAKNASVYFKIEKTQSILQTGICFHKLPAISIKINL